MKQLIDRCICRSLLVVLACTLLFFPLVNASAQEVTFGESGGVWEVRDLVQQAIREKGLPYRDLGRYGLLRSTGGSGGGFRWNDNGTPHYPTLNKVCEILGYSRYVRSTCLDKERSHRYRHGKCNYHSPSDDELTWFDPGRDNFTWRGARPKYGNTWIATITCADPLNPCNDGIDNDGDGLIDGDDPICELTDGERETAECQDNLDNDNDGKIDFDGYCPREPACKETTITTNGHADVVKRFTVPCDGIIRAQPREEETLVSVVKAGTNRTQYLVLCDEDFIEDRCEHRKHLCCGRDDEDVDDDGALVCNRDNQFLGTPREENNRECPTDGVNSIPIPVVQGDVISLGQWERGGASSFTFYPSDTCDNGVEPDPDCDGPNDDDEEGPRRECTPGDEETRDCWTDGVGICELGWEGRWCNDNGTWSDWGSCEAEFYPGQRSEDCHNDLDDDCDGATDEHDSDCQSSGDLEGTIDGGWYYGDANTDQCVNIIDLSILASNWGSGEAVWSDGDFDSNGIINFADFALLASNWGKCNPNARSLISTSGPIMDNSSDQLVAEVLIALNKLYQRNGRNVRSAGREIQGSLSRYEKQSLLNRVKVQNVKRVLKRSMKRAGKRRGRKQQDWKRFSRQWGTFGEALSIATTR